MAELMSERYLIRKEITVVHIFYMVKVCHFVQFTNFIKQFVLLKRSVSELTEVLSWAVFLWVIVNGVPQLSLVFLT